MKISDLFAKINIQCPHCRKSFVLDGSISNKSNTENPTDGNLDNEFAAEENFKAYRRAAWENFLLKETLSCIQSMASFDRTQDKYDPLEPIPNKYARNMKHLWEQK